MTKKIVLAYSGGLDTSVILKWLQLKFKCPVVTFTADLGQGEELKPVKKIAESLGVIEVFVEDLKQRKLSQTSIEKNFSQNFIQKFNSKNLADLVGTISGVSILKTGTNIVKPIINGVYGSRVLIIQDGSKLQDHEWGDDHAPSVDVNSIDRLQLIKGAMGLQYGNAIGGIIKISPIEFIPKDTLFGGVFG